MCPYLEYVDDITVCKVYGTNQMPQQCQDRLWTKIKDSCLSAYKHTSGMRHLLWAKKVGHLNKMRVVHDILNQQYGSLDFVVQTFIVPYIKHVPNTLACSYTWLDEWGLCDYLDNMPAELENGFFAAVEVICRRHCKKQLLEKLLLLIKKPTKPITAWLKQLKKHMWS